VVPVLDQLLFFILVVPGIEPGPLDLWPRTLTTRPQRRSYPSIHITIMKTFSSSREATEQLGTNVMVRVFNTGLLVRSQFLIRRANSELVSKSHFALHTSALPLVT
jgi:hypothetical protein